MAGVLIKSDNGGTIRHTGRTSLEHRDGVMHLEAKGLQGLLATPASRNRFSLVAPEGSGPGDLDLRLPASRTGGR